MLDIVGGFKYFEVVLNFFELILGTIVLFVRMILEWQSALIMGELWDLNSHFSFVFLIFRVFFVKCGGVDNPGA